MAKLSIISLKNQAAFDQVNDGGKRLSNSHFVVVAKKGTNCEQEALHVHVGFKVSRKYGKAVERNLIKRRCKAIIRDFYHTKVNQSCLSYIIIPRQLTKTADYRSICSNLTKLLRTPLH